MDAYLFAVPLYNFGPSQHFKTYVDLVTTDPRMGPGATPGVNPALDAFTDMADHIRAGAEQQAREHGRTLATRHS